MAEVFRPDYYVNPSTGKRVRKSFPGAIKRRSKTWWARYYVPDRGNRRRVKVKLYRDRKASETRAAELERRGERLDAEALDPLDGARLDPFDRSRPGPHPGRLADAAGADPPGHAGAGENV